MAWMKISASAWPFFLDRFYTAVVLLTLLATVAWLN